ncbi:MAG: UMP kinase [Malacoplasma sp.]|nr:UMP kinase [Malacoplasma sp.]
MNNKETLLLKISGASLKAKNDIIDFDFIKNIARQIKLMTEKFKIAIVLGGGNIWRGKTSDASIERYKADQMGMLATMINSLAMESIFQSYGIKTKIYSTIDMDKIANNYVIKDLLQSLQNNEVIILACGTGRPYFTTDTGTAVSAAEIKANFILMGKNNVDGVYSKDPHVHSDAVFYPKLTYERALSENLGVMDSSAVSICKENGIKTIVFKINEPNSIINALTMKSKRTIIE